MDIDQAVEAALRNIAQHGDTDIFPFPFEKHVFYDNSEQCKQLLQHRHQHFEAQLGANPPQTIKSLTQIGYAGFRWATQIEPFWNAYYLALVIALADQIESGPNTREREDNLLLSV